METPRKQYIATDLEGTLTTAEGWKSVQHYFLAHGKKADFQRFFLLQSPRVLMARLGLLKTSVMRLHWMNDMAVLFKGWTKSQLAGMGEWIFEHDLWPQRREAVLGEIMQHHADGGTVVLVSALYQPMLDVVAQRLGSERVEAIGTPLEFGREQAATGRCAGPVCMGEVKAQRIRERLQTEPLEAAYGDTGPDAPMLALSRQPVAVYPDLDLSNIALARGWRVIGA